MSLTAAVLLMVVLIGLKSIIVGQYWPWQYRDGKCPHCGSRKPKEGE